MKKMTMKIKPNDASLITPAEMTSFFKFDEPHKINLPLIHTKFALHRIESFRHFHKLPLLPHRKPVYDFIYITGGKSIRSRGFDTYEVEKNQFFFLPAFQILASEDMSLDIKGYYCHFDLDIFNNKIIKSDFVNAFPFMQYTANPIVEINDEKDKDIIYILDRLEKEYRSVNGHNFELISAYLYTLFLEIKPFVQEEIKNYTDSASQITQKYKQALSQYIYEYQKVTDYAEMLAVSPSHLNRCVHSTTGKTAQNLLFDLLILEAKVLLKQSNLNISEIAFKIGKKDPSDFSRFFKSYSGMSPRDYRES
jgi:AraC family transcriptional regulator, transcriptional activator of pobA